MQLRTAMPRKITLIREDKTILAALTLSLTPLESGDYVIFDSRSVNTYLLSGYTRGQLMRHILPLTQEPVE